MIPARVLKTWSYVTSGALVVGLLAAVPAIVVTTAAKADTAITGVDLSRYVLVGRHDLPEPTRTQAPPNSLLTQEASSVTYDWDTGTLFVVGDGGTSVVQVSKTGQLIDSMTLAPGSSPQGTTFYDTEAITYVGDGQFVLGEERYRQVDLFTYVPGGTLTAGDVQTVKLGTTIGNIGIEGVSYDPQTSAPGSPGFIVVKEKQPESIFQTNVDFADGTATNGSPTTDESVNLFDPSLAGLNDFSDVFALSNLPNLTGPDTSHVLIISQESGKIENVDRQGNVESTLTIEDPDSPISVVDETHEGVTMDRDGNLYTVSEDGGGDINHPQLWVYAPSTAADQPPTAVELQRPVTSVPEDVDTSAPVKLADVAIVDDGIGTNNLSVSGPDAGIFQVDNTGLYIKAGTTFDAAVQSTYNVTVSVDDPDVGSTPDASATFTLTVTPAGATPAGVIVSEVAPWASGNAPYAADWFELTNESSSSVNLSGWKMDDNSNDVADAVPLAGVSLLAAGKSAVFFEDTSGDDETIQEAFARAWFGSDELPAGFLIGHYGGSGVGLSTGGDAVNIYDDAGDRVTGVAFGTSPSSAPFPTFDNTAGLGSTTLPLPVISTLSAVGVNGAFLSADGAEIGSPGGAAPPPPPAANVIISEVAPFGSSESYGADWFEVTNTGNAPADLTGWKMDDSSNSFASAVPLAGLDSLPAGQSAVFFEDTGGLNDATVEAAFAQAWYGTSTLPAGFAIGHYGGSGVGLSTGGDGVNLFDAAGDHVTGVSFGSSPSSAPLATFDNTAGVSGAISTLSAVGANGAFLSADGGEIGSPDGIAPTPPPPPSAAVIISEVAPFGSSESYGADWFEVTNTGSSPVDLTGWKMDDSSDSSASAVPLAGLDSLPAGKSAVFFEDTGGLNDATVESQFAQAWFGTSALPAGFLIGHYGGSGVGLSTGGDAVNLFDASGSHVTGVTFGSSPSTAPLATFDNTAGVSGAISTLSAIGVNGAFLSADSGEIGSPDGAPPPPPPSGVVVSEVAPWGSGDSPYAADWFEVTNNGTSAVSLTGWKMDDNSNSFSNAVPLAGVSSLPAGKAAVFFEDTGGLVDATVETEFAQEWFGTSTLPAGFLIGHYGGSGVGLSTGGDAVNVFDANGQRVTGVAFGNSPSSAPFATFDNTAGLGSTTLPLPVISALSAVGVNGAFVSADDQEIGSPGGVLDTTAPVITATANPPANANGWNDTSVTVSFNCADSGLGVDNAASSLADQVLTSSGTATGTCVDRAGNASTASYTAQIDTAAPTVTYSGNAGSYGILSTVAITCTAADALSGIAASTCADLNAPGWSLGAGSHALSAQATDRAGNVGSGTATFTVTVKPTDLATLTTQFVTGSARYQASGPVTRALVVVLVDVAANVLLDFTPSAKPAVKAQLVTAYGKAVQALVQAGWLTASQATTLTGLAGAI